MDPEYDMSEPRPMAEIVTRIVGTEEVLEIRQNGALVAVMLDSDYWDALKAKIKSLEETGEWA